VSAAWTRTPRRSAAEREHERPQRLRRVRSEKRNPTLAGLSDGGRCWARTSDPQLVDSGQPFAPVPVSALKPFER